MFRSQNFLNSNNRKTNSLPSELLANLTAYWKLEESSGTRINNHNPGIYDLTAIDSITGVIGKINNGQLAISSTARGLTTPHTSDFSLTQSMSFSIWANINGSNNFELLSNCIGNGSYGYSFYGSSNTFTIQCNNGSINESNLISPLLPNTYYHFVITWDVTILEFRIYLNSSLEITETSVSAPDDSFTGNVGIGNIYDYFGVTSSIHSFDEAAYWTNRVLSEQEVILLYNGGVGVTY
jgi:hypothetical protein